MGDELTQVTLVSHALSRRAIYPSPPVLVFRFVSRETTRRIVSRFAYRGGNRRLGLLRSGPVGAVVRRRDGT
jgi:hypothetical protein